MIAWNESTKTAKADFARLMAMPVTDPERPKLRDLYPFSEKTLLRLCAKYMTPKLPRPMKFDLRGNVYPAWTKPKQLPCPPFESGLNVLPGFDSWLEAQGVKPAESRFGSRLVSVS